MRVEFSKTITQFLKDDPKSIFITGDLGYNAFEEMLTLGRQFLNAGVAEQNMVGFAAGLALCGMKPWVYSIVPFVTIRALEQIRNDVCFHNLPVRIVGNGGGYTYGIMGSTHHALEDLGILKGLPNMTLFFPCSNDQVPIAMELMKNLSGPSYLRLAISAFSSKLQPIDENPLTLTRHYLKGSSLTVIGVGHATHIVLTAAEEGGSKLDIDLFGICKFPFDLKNDISLLKSIEKTKRVLVVEEHYLAGSIGESLKSALSGIDSFEIMAARYFIGQRYGSAKFHAEQSGISPQQVLKHIRGYL